ncbi:MAG: M23 family metallopeptidase [Thermoanaerobaculia bacterium]
MPKPPTPVTVAGRPQLVYELHITNFSREPLVLEQVDILDADDERVLAELQGEALNRRLGRPEMAPREAGPPTLAPHVRGVLYLEIELADNAPPRALEHRIVYRVADPGAQQPAVVQGARTPVPPERPVVLTPPLRGGPWVAIYHPSWERGHRRVVYAVDGRARIPGRFAIDWVLLDADGRRADGDQDQVANWYGYGADVLAVADGVVVAARDDVAESATLSDHPRHPLEDATGNYVTLDLGGGRYAAYEHLKPGSVRVAVGEHVRRGQVIGSIGFTGHSMGPHLHFHVAGANSPLGAEGLPFVLDEFTVLGSYDDFDALDNVPWTPLDEADRARRSEELPAPNTVVDFATSPWSKPPPEPQ